MSEIFDFLKKTETERRKKAIVPEPAIAEPLPEPVEEFKPEVTLDVMPPAQLPVDVEICETDRFDLALASPQIRNVLEPLTVAGEQFRLLRSRLGLMQKQRGIKTVLVTSTVPEEGKTFTASGLVGVFAQEPGKRILLIDADMRKPRSGAGFGINGAGDTLGLSEVLRGNIPFNRAILKSANPEFCFLPSGPLPSNPSELLGSQQFERLLKAAAENFDFVIVDSPPILSLSDTNLLIPLCDTVVLVLRANSTPAKLAAQAVDRIGRDHICGIVINRQKRVSTSRYYYQYYYRSSQKNGQ